MAASSVQSRSKGLILKSLIMTSVVLSACGGSKGTGSTQDESGSTSGSGSPVYGGKAIYGIAAENADGWCLPEAQLAAPGILVARTMFETLTIPDESGELVPFLAKSLKPNEDFTEWKIDLREGIKFHDGTDLDATVVKNNIDAYRGAYPARVSLLFRFVYENIADITVTGPLSIVITTNKPWPSLPQALWSTGRTGIMAQAQLDDPETCATELIGTGPFSLVEWNQNERLVVKKNPDYWDSDDDAKKLPYLDEIEFRPIIEGSSRTNALLSGEVNMMAIASPPELQTLKGAEEDGKITNNFSDVLPTTAFIQLNNATAPFNNKNARMAVIHGIDMEVFNQTINLGLLKSANGPFAKGTAGYLKDSGYPTFDLPKAKSFAAAYETETGEKLSFSLISPTDQLTKASMELVQEMLRKVGIEVKVEPLEIAAIVSTAVAGSYQAMAFANFPGGDPDSNRVWWFGGSPVNLSRFNDPVINRLLDEGRATSDPESRQKIYADINRRFASEGYSVWLNWMLSDVATSTNVHGVLGPKLPGGQEPSGSLVNGHPMSGVWIDD